MSSRTLQLTPTSPLRTAQRLDLHARRGGVHDHFQVWPQLLLSGWEEFPLGIDGLDSEPVETILRSTEAKVLRFRGGGGGVLPGASLVARHVKTDLRDGAVFGVVFEGDIELAVLKEDNARAWFLGQNFEPHEPAGQHAHQEHGQLPHGVNSGRAKSAVG